MTIEVRELLIKSTIVQSGGEEREPADAPPRILSDTDREELKSEILAACREMVDDLLQRRKER